MGKKNLELCPSFIPYGNDKDKIKIVLMLPHWSYSVDKQQCFDLINKIIELNWIYLVIKAHTRKSGGLTQEEIYTY